MFGEGCGISCEECTVDYCPSRDDAGGQKTRRPLKSAPWTAGDNRVEELVDDAPVLEALALAQRVFEDCVAPGYSQEGIEEFQRTVKDPDFYETLRIYAAYSGEEMVGMIATARSGSHIALFFVAPAYQRHGVGRALFTAAANDDPAEVMTVNAAPEAAVYRRLGFAGEGGEEEKNGIRFIPMSASLL